MGETLRQSLVCIFKEDFDSSMCGMSFSSRDELKEHVRTTHFHRTCVKEGCPWTNDFFAHSKKELTTHRARTKHPLTPRICEISRCPQFTSRFETKAAFDHHEMSVHRTDTRIMEMVNENMCRDPDCENYYLGNSRVGMLNHIGKKHNLLRVYACDSPECAKWDLNTFHRWNNHRKDCRFLEALRLRLCRHANLKTSKHATEHTTEITMDNSDLDAILDSTSAPSEDLKEAVFDWGRAGLSSKDKDPYTKAVRR
ncbi:hypothetical protein BKA65DRAFT_480343 [Rhexocercosporidium sp. MPI-PUGE-AT-0058]|nr:hypothetical protein BKA65DRAFT_480343 [Rhexocercosporidium sp. MPI-PUGE-AT-0058]